MKKVFQDAKDKNVAAVLIYADSNNYACSDAEAKVKMTKAELMDAFLKRAFIVGSGTYTVPSAMTVAEGYVSITAGSDTVYSKEYVAASSGTT